MRPPPPEFQSDLRLCLEQFASFSELHINVNELYIKNLRR